MTTTITDVKVILTAPEGINLVVVKVETNQPGLFGLGCATFAYRHLAVKCLLEQYLRPLVIGRDAEAIEELWQLMHQNAYWRIGRKIDARFQWQHALQLEPDQKQKEIIERKLQFGLDSVSASGQ